MCIGSIGKKKDVDDPRSASLLHLIHLLGIMSSPPKLLFLENVKNFEVSEARQRLLAILVRRKYTFEEFLVSPTSIGIPNTRLRYYLLAWQSESPRVSHSFPSHLPAEKNANDSTSVFDETYSARKSESHETVTFTGTSEICSMFTSQFDDNFQSSAIDIKQGKSETDHYRNVSLNPSESPTCTDLSSSEFSHKTGSYLFPASSICHHVPLMPSQKDSFRCMKIGDYLDYDLKPDFILRELLLSKETIHRSGSFRFDVVTSESLTSTTFAKGYGVKGHFRGSGPILLLTDSLKPEKIDPFADSEERNSGNRRNFGPEEKLDLGCDQPDIDTATSQNEHLNNPHDNVTLSLQITNDFTHFHKRSRIVPVPDVCSALYTFDNERARGVFRCLGEYECARLFSTKEMLCLHGYPSTFSLPDDITEKQGRALIGNSVNVIVITHLLTHLLNRELENNG